MPTHDSNPLLRQARRAGLYLLLVAGGCSTHAESNHHEQTGEYAATTPLRKDTELVTEYVAQIRAIQHIEVRALERGYLQDIFPDEGQLVHAGDRMFQIMPTIYQAELQVADAEAEYAGIEFRNTQALHDSKVVSPNELALAQARFDKAKAERALANAHLQLTQLRAPFDGLMGRLEVRKGSLLEEGELLTTLSDNSQMWVYFNVTEAEYLAWQRQAAGKAPQTVKLRLADGEVFEHEGVVSTIEADFNNETGNIAFRATLPNPDGLLRHGETGNVLMTRTVRNALLIPQKATFDVLDKKYVFVVDDEGVAHVRQITVAEELPHLYVVTEGLTEQDHILLEGLRRVRDGHEVQTRFEEPELVMANLAPYAE